MYKAIKTNAVTLIPEIVDVDFKIKGDYIYHLLQPMIIIAFG